MIFFTPSPIGMRYMHSFWDYRLPTPQAEASMAAMKMRKSFRLVHTPYCLMLFEFIEFIYVRLRYRVKTL